MRTNKELVQLLIDNFKLFGQNQCWGLCEFIYRPIYREHQLIDFEEKKRLDIIIFQNRPANVESYFYPIRQEAPRMELLHKILKDLENER